MNGNAQLYRSTSDGMFGGVCAGLGHYFKIDPTIVRLLFLFLMLLTWGGFAGIYFLLWLLMPTTGSTATQPNEVIQENINEIGARVRGFAGGMTGPANPTSSAGPVSAPGTPGTPGTPATPTAQPNGGPAPSYNQTQLAQTNGGSYSRSRHGASPTLLIVVGIFFLMANTGIFHAIHWSMWWPLLLVGLGVMMLKHRNRP